MKEFILPLCFSDGLLLRPLAPAVPLPDSIWLDPLNEEKPYRVIAPLSRGCAAVAVYNLRLEPGSAVKGWVGPEDYPWAGAMTGSSDSGGAARGSLPPEGIVIYDWYAQKGARLTGEFSFDLKGFSDRLLLLCPVREGWAVVGNPEKYLSPQAVKSLSLKPGSAVVRLREAGPLVIWSGRGKVRVGGGEVEALGGGFFLARGARGTWTFRR